MVAPDDEHVDWLIRTADNVKQAPRRDNNYLGAATSMTPKPKPGSQLVPPTPTPDIAWRTH
jgi:hypothetical protein